MRRRGFFAFAAGIMVVAGCGSTRTSGASTANGAQVQLWTCNGGANQQWGVS